ncbi:MAG: hypothetical protein H0Z32_09120 [Bacillaceae bacterium]|nr:hypothetical protein [Bacillaceae bacterium]
MSRKIAKKDRKDLWRTCGFDSEGTNYLNYFALLHDGSCTIWKTLAHEAEARV